MPRLLSRVMLALLVAQGLGCSEDEKPASTADAGPEAGSPVDAISFAEDIHPILRAKCSGGQCHSMDQDRFQPGHAAEDVEDAYESTQTPSGGGRVYDRIVARASGRDPFGWMPPNPPCLAALDAAGCLTTEELELIEAWVAQGAPP